MSRAFWFAAGAVSGAYGLVKVKRTAQNFTPDGVAARFAAYRTGARMFKDGVVSGMADREQELRVRLSLDAAAPGTRQIAPGPDDLPERAIGAAAAASDTPRAS